MPTGTPTNSAFIPTLWGARFIQEVYDAYVYGPMTNRFYEGEIRQMGDTVKIPTLNDQIVVGNYTQNTDIGDPETLTGQTQDLQITQAKFFHFYVDDIDAVQNTPDVMQESMRLAGVKMAETVDDYLRGLYVASFNSSRRVTSSNVANTGDTQRGHIPTLIRLKKEMDEANVPMMNRWLIAPPAFCADLENYLLGGASNTAHSSLFTPATNEKTLKNGFVGTLLGFKLYKTNKISTSGTGGTTMSRCVASAGREALTFAEQITEVESYRPEQRFGDAVKGLYVYGGQVQRPEFVYEVAIPGPAVTRA